MTTQFMLCYASPSIMTLLYQYGLVGGLGAAI